MWYYDKQKNNEEKMQCNIREWADFMKASKKKENNFIKS
jgi:hypothetical protein